MSDVTDDPVASCPHIERIESSAPKSLCPNCGQVSYRLVEMYDRTQPSRKRVSRFRCQNYRCYQGKKGRWREPAKNTEWVVEQPLD